MPIYIGQSTKNQKEIIYNGKQLSRVYLGDKLVWQKILATLGYGALYNFYCTQEQHKEVKFGYLYNRKVAQNPNVANIGWAVPTQDQLSMIGINIGQPVLHLKEEGTDHWLDPNLYSDNLYGLNLRGCGTRNNDGSFADLKSAYYIWSNSTNGYYYILINSIPNFTSNLSFNNIGCSIRLVKNDTQLIDGQEGTYSGNDGKIYKTICVQGIEIMASDLMETKYRDGSLIPEVTSNTTWASLTTGARCSYDNLESNAGSTKRLAPSGWHVASDAEWTTLVNGIGGTSVAGQKLRESGFVHWNETNDGTNDYGFSWLGSGYRSNLGVFFAIKQNSQTWTSTQLDANNAYQRYAQPNSAVAWRTSSNKKFGHSIRLIKDTSDWTPGETVTDADGNVYPTVKIGNQVWVAANWKSTKWNDGSPILNVTDNAAWAALTTAGMCFYGNDPLNA